MKCFLQYTLARLGLWEPVIGAIYRPDEKVNPFEGPRDLVVLDVKDGYVQYKYIKWDTIRSMTVTSFAAFWRRVKP